jgi:putative solute:sodium symporter small subunit
MSTDSLTPEAFATRVNWLRWSLLLAWASITFGVAFFARDLNVSLFGTPVGFWMAAQGSVLLFLIIVWAYALLVNHWEKQATAKASSFQED